MYNRPPAAFDVIDQDIETAEAVCNVPDETWNLFGIGEVDSADQKLGSRVSEILFSLREFLFPVVPGQGYLHA